MNKRILLALSCFLLAGITLLTIASTYTSSDSAHRFNGTIYATDASLAGTARVNAIVATNTITIGTGGGGSADASVTVSRTVSDTGVGNAHGFSDGAAITRSGTIGYCSYDSIPQFTGAQAYDHFVAFQANPTYNSSGHMNWYEGVTWAPVVSQSVITNSAGYYVNNATGAGTIQNQYGVYVVPTFNKGTVSNYGFYSSGETISYNGGRFYVGRMGATPVVPDANDVSTIVVADLTSGKFGEIGIGGNPPATSSQVGSLHFDNYNLGTDKRIAIIAGVLNGAANTGCMQFLVYKAGSQTQMAELTGTGFGILTNAPSEALEVLGSIKASGAYRNGLTVGATTYIDANYRSQTNQVAGALTFSYCTNGVHGVDSTTVRWLFNSSGSDQTLTFPIIAAGVNGWRTNVYSAVPPAITNGTIMKVILDVGGPTDTLARQTNCYVKFEYYQ